MFDWLKRKRRRNTDAEDRWSIATSEDDGRPIIFRIRSSRPSRAIPPEYPRLMAIQWKYVPENDSGMPSNADRERMDLLEDLLDANLEEHRQAFLTVVVTGNGVMEWQWYARDDNETLRQLNEALAGHDKFPIDVFMDDDPEWSAYARFDAIASEKS